MVVLPFPCRPADVQGVSGVTVQLSEAGDAVAAVNRSGSGGCIVSRRRTLPCVLSERRSGLAMGTDVLKACATVASRLEKTVLNGGRGTGGLNGDSGRGGVAMFKGGTCAGRGS